MNLAHSTSFSICIFFNLQGGPGMIFSNGLLRQLAPKLKACLGNLVTAHEDIELGRCVRKMTGVKCTMSWESMELFYQYFENRTSAHNIKNPQNKDLGNARVICCCSPPN